MSTKNAPKPNTRDRAEIREEYTWDLSQIYSDWKTWEAGLDGLQELMDSYKELKGTLAEGPQRILEASLLSDELGQLAYRVYQYPGLMQSQDTRDNTVQARLEQVRLAAGALQALGAGSGVGRQVGIIQLPGRLAELPHVAVHGRQGSRQSA